MNKPAKAANGMRIGVLAVQGDFEAHARALERAGAAPVLVKHSRQVAQVDGLILPGGESSTLLKFLTEEGLMDAIRDAARRGRPLFGTCAGAILLAREVANPAQCSLALMDIGIRRNAYGRQISSFIAREDSSRAWPGDPLEMVFIRAPIIERVGASVEVLAQCRGLPVLVRQGRLLASTFHPELTADSRVHQYFLGMVGGHRAD
jgi:5'-phosphate synthase pdxT subunit